MRYTVIYLPDAQNELADAWNRSPDRQALTDAANRLEQALQSDPTRNAIPFYGDWLLIDLPVGVVFRIDEGDCKVIVTQVWVQP